MGQRGPSGENGVSDNINLISEMIGKTAQTSFDKDKVKPSMHSNCNCNTSAKKKTTVDERIKG